MFLVAFALRSRYCVYAMDEETNRNKEKGQNPKDDDFLEQEEHELPPPTAAIIIFVSVVV